MIAYNRIKAILALSLIGVVMAGCEAGGNDPGRVYFPDMMYSQAYETYTSNPNFNDSMTARKPVEGTVPRGYTPYRYPNTFNGYDSAGKHLRNPLDPTEEVLDEGERLYGIHCDVCHGPKGEGQGSIVKNGNYPPPPAYSQRLPTITEGNMFHSITYGRNLMGSYASHLTYEERWEVILYIQKMTGIGPFAEDQAKSDTASAQASASAGTTAQQ